MGVNVDDKLATGTVQILYLLMSIIISLQLPLMIKCHYTRGHEDVKNETNIGAEARTLLAKNILRVGEG